MKSRIININKTKLLAAPGLDLVAVLLLLLALPLAALGQANYATPYTFTTLAGLAGNWGSADGSGSAAQFDLPYGVAVDTNGNVYVADTYNNTIRKVTPAGVVTTLAGLAGSRGSADGTGSAARFYNPYGVAADGGGSVYVVDSNNHTVRKVTPAGVVTTLAGLPGVGGSANGSGSAARFYYPVGVAVDTTGNVYVADTYNCTIRKVTPAGVVTTLAGLAGSSGSADGTGSAARFNYPYGVAVDTGGTVYVVDSNNNTIRKVTPAGVVTTLAGLAGAYGSADGTGSAARFYYPDGLAVDTNGNVYVADTYNDTIRKVTPAGVVTTLAGLVGSSGSADGTGSAAQFYQPYGVAVDLMGNVYVADTYNNAIRKGGFVPFVQVTANPTNGTVPLTVQFTSASMDNAGNAITDWAWTFGDGSTSAVQNPSHTYTAAGTFHPGLTASNNLGSAVVGSVPSVAASLPTVQVTANPTSGSVPLTVNFTAASVDSSGHPIASWAWTFGDGSTSAVQNPSHTYQTTGPSTNGIFFPNLTATNSLGFAVLSDIPSISTWLPTVQFTATPTVGGVPLVVQFTCPNTDSAGNAITHWNWTFGDGFSSTAQSPSHTYSSGGLFFPSLVVTNSNGTAISAPGPGIIAAAYSGLVLNGGFETGDFFGWTLNADGGLYDLVDTFNQSTEGIQPHTGSYFARLGQTGRLGYLSETLATAAGANYLLSFSLNSPDGQTPNQFLVSWNGTLLFSGINLPASGWTNLQFVLTATGSTTVLQFGFRDDPTAFGLDDISVMQVSPTLTLQPQNQTVACHSNAQFTVAAAGPPPLHYQWRKNGAPLAGATDTAYNVTPLTCQGPDSYSVVVTNSGGSITSAVTTLTVLDTNPPSITCPTNLVVTTDPGQCSAIVAYSATATDNCAVVSLSVNPPSGSVFPKGTNVVTCVAIDCGGNSNSCSFTVTVLDREPPAFACPTNQIIVSMSSNGAPAFFTATSTDNCGANTPVVFTPPSGSVFPPGTNTVQCLATDSSGNTNSCAFTVTVIPQAPGVEPPGSTNYGKSYADWSVAWWQWGLGLPTNDHPFTVSLNFDVTEGQTGQVWFLAMPDGTNARTCIIPDGKALFFALPDSEWSSLEGFATETDQRANAKLWGDHIVNPFCLIDGVPVQSIGSFRIGSPQFNFTAPTPWMYGDTGGTGTTVADGYYIFLDPLPVGPHHLHFGGGFHFAVAQGDAFDFDDILDMTYSLTVAPASVSVAQQGTYLMVSWPQTATTYVLEENDSLDPANWLPADAPVQPAGTVYQVTIPINKSNQFFRLRKQSP